ncbi:MAG: hypothetical protein KDA75_18350, partial [Planctomycetaceae bacterium]|nr:hypothetical protein [Planctomycetaceae bacterium]
MADSDDLDFDPDDAELAERLRQRDVLLSTIDNLPLWLKKLSDDKSLLNQLTEAWQEMASMMTFSLFAFGGELSLPGPDDVRKFCRLSDVLAVWCDGPDGVPIDPSPMLRCARIRSEEIQDWRESVATGSNVDEAVRRKWESAVEDAEITIRRIQNRLRAIGQRKENEDTDDLKENLWNLICRFKEEEVWKRT